MNLHLLLHFENMIDNCGPLSAYNMFGFENKIMFLKSLVSGTTDVLSQIATKYPISISDENITHRNEKNMDSSNVNLYHNKTVSIKSEHRQILESTMSIEKDQAHLSIWARARIDSQIFTSSYAVITKSIDYFVRTKNGKIGKIEFFFGDPIKPKLLLQLYEEKYQKITICHLS